MPSKPSNWAPVTMDCMPCCSALMAECEEGHMMEYDAVLPNTDIPGAGLYIRSKDWWIKADFCPFCGSPVNCGATYVTEDGVHVFADGSRVGEGWE